MVLLDSYLKEYDHLHVLSSKERMGFRLTGSFNSYKLLQSVNLEHMPSNL